MNDVFENTQDPVVLPLAYKDAEKPMPGAPIVEVDDKHGCIPQHFLQYEHSYESVTEVVSDIEFSSRYPVFVCEDKIGLYVQIGIIGHDNYLPKNEKTPKHIVYGRKWRIETNLPSGEIIQTVFLALKKAREHELRELVRFTDISQDKKSTPFSGHHDIPYMATKLHPHKEHAHSKPDSSKEALQSMLALLDFERHPIALKGFQVCDNGKYLIDLKISSPAEKQKEQGAFPELLGIDFSILIDEIRENAVFHAIVDALIHLSDRYVDENFKYRDFARFSHSVSIAKISEISIALRADELLNCPDFFGHYKNINHAVDSTRVPVLRKPTQAIDSLKMLAKTGELRGHLPKVK